MVRKLPTVPTNAPIAMNTRLKPSTNPSAFVIGGGVSKAGQFLIDVIEKHFKKNAFVPCSDVKFVIASLGNDAGIYGAVAQVL